MKSFLTLEMLKLIKIGSSITGFLEHKNTYTYTQEVLTKLHEEYFNISK